MIKTPTLIPELQVFDYLKSLNFYTKLAGFTLLYDRPENNFAMLELNGAHLMIEGFSSKNRSWITGPLESPLGRGINLQIEVQDVKNLYQNFKEAQYPIFLDIEERWYQTGNEKIGHNQFLVQDPDGYLLRFFEKIRSS